MLFTVLWGPAIVFGLDLLAPEVSRVPRAVATCLRRAVRSWLVSRELLGVWLAVCLHVTNAQCRV